MPLAPARARHQALGKAFALKLIKTPIAMDPRIREMFYREARLASACSHDNICSIVDFGEDPAFGLFMVMELLDGQTMHSKLRQGGRLAPKVACDVMWQVCDAVRYMHGRAILHGDLKSDNIFLVRSSAQRRAVKLLKLFAASAVFDGRTQVHDGDFFVLRHIWNNLDQVELLAEIVNPVVDAYYREHPAERRFIGPQASLDDLLAELNLIRELLTSGTELSDIQMFSQLKNLSEIKAALAAMPSDTSTRMLREVDQLLETVFASSKFGL